MTRSWLGKVVQVPDTWEAWAVRILTIAIMLVFVAVYYFSSQVTALQSYIAESRQQRTEYQQQELARQCTLLRSVGVSAAELRELKC